MTRLAHILTTLCLLPLIACVPFEQARLKEPRRFDLLQDKQLSLFEQRLAAERQTGQDDAWTRLGVAWVKLVSCSPLPQADDPFEGLPSERRDPVARFLFETLRLEEARRMRLVYHKGTGYRAKSISGTLLGRIDDEDFFVRDALPTEAQIVWPAMEEAWADELPAPLDQPSQCKALYKELLAQGQQERIKHNKALEELRESAGPRWRTMTVRTRLGMRADVEPDPSDKLLVDPKDEPQRTLAKLERTEQKQLQRTIQWGNPALLSGSAKRVLWRVRYHGLVFAWEHAAGLRGLKQASDTEKAIATSWEALAQEHAQALVELDALMGPRDTKNSAGDLVDRVRVLPFLWLGWRRASQERHKEALALFERAKLLGVNPQNQWVMKYGILAAQQRLGLIELSAKTNTEDLPPREDPLYSAYVWRLGRALDQTGQTDRFMALALGAFRDRRYASDPFLRALYLRMLRIVVQPPFEARTLELLEDLGPRSKTFERVREYAAVALDQGRASNAEAAARWLLSKHRNAKYHARYWSLIALAAFLENDFTKFNTALSWLTQRPKELQDALDQRSRSTFFASADAQLAGVFRQMLPLMAEWGESESAVALRQKWIKIITTKVSEFVKRTPESLARPALIELYRLASAMLKTGTPRAYPERVGKSSPVPLVLGTVKVSERDLDPYEPVADLSMLPIDSVTLIPQDLPVWQWLPRWQTDAPNTQGTP